MKCDKKIKVCFILPNRFPVPAVKGGATETLVQFLIDENEKYGVFDFICVTPTESRAVTLASKYKNTKFIFIKDNLFGLIPLKRKVNFIGKVFRFFKIQYRLYVNVIYHKIKNLGIDYIVVEGGEINEYKSLKKIVDAKLIYSLHGAFRAQTNFAFYDYYLASSKYVKEKFTENGIVSKNIVKLHYNAISTTEFIKKSSAEEKEKLRKSLNIKDEKVIIFLGRLVPEKGVKELLIAFREMKNYDKCKLIIVGNSNFGYEMETPYEKELKTIALDMNERIVFTGFIHNSQIYKYFQISDVAVFPTLIEEAFGMVAAEAMCSALPVIVTDSGALPEITNEKCGIIVKRDENLIKSLSEKMDYLIQNDKVRSKMGSYGIKTALQYSPEQYYKDFVKNINEMDE